MRNMDWFEWHSVYDNPNISLKIRLAVIADFLKFAWENLPRELRILSICAGQAREIEKAVSEGNLDHRSGIDLLDLSEANLAIAVRRLAPLSKGTVTSHVCDAGHSSSYEGHVPANCLVIVGVFSNLSLAHAQRLVARLPQFCSPGAYVIWTRKRDDTDSAGNLRAAFGIAQFRLVRFALVDDVFVVIHQYCGELQRVQLGERIFEFVS